MNQADFQAATPYATFGQTVIESPVEARMQFIRKTYMHLAAAIYAFVSLEFLLFSLGVNEMILSMLSGRFAWLIMMGGFIGVSMLADRWARSDTSIGMQYAGLFLYVLAQAIILAPLLTIAQGYAINVGGIGEVSVIPAAGVTTLVMFGGLTAMVFLTKKDFSFLGGILNLVMFGAFALIAVSVLFGFNLGIFFSVAMVIAACGYILYDTSNIMHHYRTDQHVAASLALFASVALLFWYVLQILMSLSNRN